MTRIDKIEVAISILKTESAFVTTRGILRVELFIETTELIEQPSENLYGKLKISKNEFCACFIMFLLSDGIRDCSRVI